MRLRTILWLTICTIVVYRLLPAPKRGAVRERALAFGQALALSLLLFWAWMLLARLVSWWWDAG